MEGCDIETNSSTGCWRMFIFLSHVDSLRINLFLSLVLRDSYNHYSYVFLFLFSINYLFTKFPHPPFSISLSYYCLVLVPVFRAVFALLCTSLHCRNTQLCFKHPQTISPHLSGGNCWDFEVENVPSFVDIETDDRTQSTTCNENK